jgi:hypothetical protein
MTTTLNPPSDFLASELASHDWIRNLPQSEKNKLAELLLDGTAIANGNPLTATELKLTLEETYYRLYSLEAALQTAYQAFPQVCEAPIANAVETVKLIAGLVCSEAERLDLLTHRL